MNNSQSKDTPTYSLWLIPDSSSSPAIQATIDKLATKYSSLPFCPHMTICSQLTGSLVSLKSKFEKFAKASRPQYIYGNVFSHRAMFYQCLFIELVQTEELRKFYASALEVFAHNPSKEFYPHISLAYIDPQTFDQAAEIAQLDAALLKKTRYNRLILIETSGKQKHWAKILEIKLNDR